jgi:exonuclease SbcD
MVYADAEAEKKTPMELFSDLYEMQNNKQMSPEQCSFMTELIEKIWEVDV